MTVAESVRRLSALTEYPFHPEGQVALLQAFITALPTEQAIHEAVEYFLTERSCPVPRDVWDYARGKGYVMDAEARLAKIANESECRKCDGTGWELVERNVLERNQAGEQVQVRVGYRRHCDCAVGRAMKGAA